MVSLSCFCCFDVLWSLFGTVYKLFLLGVLNVNELYMSDVVLKFHEFQGSVNEIVIGVTDCKLLILCGQR